MRVCIIILMSLFLSACSFTNEPAVYSKRDPETGRILKHDIDHFTRNLSAQLVKSGINLTNKETIGYTSFVYLKNLEKTSWLGNQLAESTMINMQQNGYRFVEHKLTGVIQVTEQGDFSLSRNWKKLNGRQNIDAVLVGTLVRQTQGLLVTAKIIDMENKVILATAQGFLPNYRMGKIIDLKAIERAAILKRDREAKQDAKLAKQRAVDAANLGHQVRYQKNGIVRDIKWVKFEGDN